MQHLFVKYIHSKHSNRYNIKEINGKSQKRWKDLKVKSAKRDISQDKSIPRWDVKI